MSVGVLEEGEETAGLQLQLVVRGAAGGDARRLVRLQPPRLRRPLGQGLGPLLRRLDPGLGLQDGHNSHDVKRRILGDVTYTTYDFKTKIQKMYVEKYTIRSIVCKASCHPVTQVIWVNWVIWVIWVIQVIQVIQVIWVISVI